MAVFQYSFLEPSGQLEEGSKKLYWNTAMTFEILHLTLHLKNWINLRVARHLEAQAERLTH